MVEPESVFLLSAIAIFSCLTLATFIHAFCEKAKLSFTVGLLLGGLLLSVVTKFFGITLFEHFYFSPEIVFYVLLPTLIFESAYHLNYRQFQGVLGEVTLLATFGLLVSIGIIASGLHYFIDLPWGVSFLFGTLISATDPVAVLAIFKELRAPQKLTTIVDGESLLNDGTSLVLFQFIKSIVISGAIILTPKTFALETGNFFLSLFEGIATGIVLGWIFAYAIPHSKSKGVQLTLSLILAHVTFILAEGILHVSGILATMAAGIIMGNMGRRRLDIKTREIFSEIWEFMGFIANALIFLLLGMKLGQVDIEAYWGSMLIAGGIGIFIARPISVFFTFGISNLFRDQDHRISLPYQYATAWGGVRGALAAAAVLLIPENFTYAGQLQAMTAGVIFGTFLINATSIATVLKKLKLIDFTVSEKIQKYEVQILIDETVKQQLNEMLDKKFITPDIFGKLEKAYSSAEERTINDLESFQSTLSKKNRETEKFLTYHALGIEMQTYRKLFEKREISESRFLTLLGSMVRQTERLDRDELPDERNTSPKIAPDIPKKCPFRKDKFFDIPRKSFFYFRNRQVLKRLQHYRGRRIASWKVIQSFEYLRVNHPLFHKSSALEKIIHRYRGWNKNAETKIRKLECQFPFLVTKAKVHMAERVCLNLEEGLLTNFVKAALISEKVYKKMDEELKSRIEINTKWLRKHFH